MGLTGASDLIGISLLQLMQVRLGAVEGGLLRIAHLAEGGADALLTKPIDFAALRTEIDGRVASAA